VPPSVPGDPRRWPVLIVALAGLFTVGSTITLLVVSLSRIAVDLDSDVATLNWSIVAPMLGFGILGPAFGKAGDLWGHKRLFCFGLAGAGVFAGATVFAWDAWSLVAFRTLSASFGSATGPSALAMINRLFRGDERMRALGYWSLVGAGAPVIGVVAGGPLVEAIGWRAIFAIQAPLCAVGFAVALRLMPMIERGNRSRFDVPGAVTLALAVTGVLLAVNRMPVLGIGHPVVIAALLVTPAAGIAFVVIERRVAAPLLPLEWLGRGPLLVAVASQSLGNFAYMGGFLLAPQLLERALGLSATAIAYLVVCRPLAFAVAAPAGSRATIRFGERASGIVGCSVVAGSMLVFTTLGAGSAPWLAALALALSGVGLGMSSPALAATVASAVDPDDLGVAGALSQLMNQVGAVIGSQAMLAVQTAAGGGDPARGFPAAFALGAAVAAIAAILATRLPVRTRQVPYQPLPEIP
jgi:MFS family permease